MQRDPGGCWVLPGETRQPLKRMLRSYETERYITASAEKKKLFPHLSETRLTGVCCLQKHTSDLEWEMLWLPRGSIFVLEGTERVF